MSVCQRCGASFECGMVDAGAAQPCWCTQLPQHLPASRLPNKDVAEARCYCPACLRALIEAASSPITTQSRNP